MEVGHKECENGQQHQKLSSTKLEGELEDYENSPKKQKTGK